MSINITAAELSAVILFVQTMMSIFDRTRKEKAPADRVGYPREDSRVILNEKDWGVLVII